MNEELKNSPIADFDWDAYEKGETAGEKSREELTKTYDESLNTVKDKEVIEGTIIALNKREAVVNIGYKSDGIIPLNEFRYNPDIKIGDVVEVFIENQEDKKGQLILSHRQGPHGHALGSASIMLLKTMKSSRVTSNAAPRAV